ncbi:MAG TPA: hypothetical protein VLS89_18725, partial [Candidatus Nanopelagicales bacterium]|nr:hypothetical protein [Candidatus Nanopelagicales bacterium]
VKEWLIANALINLCDRDKASEAQKKEVDAIARKLATGKNDDTVRADAMRATVRCDPVRGRQFVLVFKKDGSFRLKQEAEKILAEPPPKKK